MPGLLSPMHCAVSAAFAGVLAGGCDCRQFVGNDPFTMIGESRI
jgi:hypothetical protein